MSVLEHVSYRTFLKSELATRSAVNPQYSLRSMAKKLGIAPSYLSTIMKGQKNLSLETAVSLATKLQLPETEAEYFYLLVQFEGAKNPILREALLKKAQAQNPDAKVNDLSVDHFRIISDWQHFAILVATELQGFQANAANLAKALGISKIETEISIDRLERLEMIERDTEGNYRKVQTNPRVVSQVPNKALQNYHRQTLLKATESLDTQTPQEKVIGSETFAIDPEQIEEFRELSERFFAQALKLSKKSKKKTSVYHLGVQFFSFTPSLGDKT